MKVIETERLILRTWKNEDADEYYRINQDQKVIEFLPASLTMEQVRDFIALMNQQFDLDGYTLWAAEEKSSGQLMGFIGLNRPTFEAHFCPCVEIGWRLGSEYWGKGYATEGARAALEYGFNQCRLKEIVAFTVSANQRSMRVMEKIGMARDQNGDFHHPKLPLESSLSLHVLYRKTNPRYAMDKDKVHLIPATIDDYPTIQNMARFYVYDMSEYMGFEPDWEMPENGLYECIDFKKYWGTPDTYPFLIRYGDELAGFAIIDKKGSESSIDYNIAQFFILRKFKGRGIGRYVAHQCFEQFPGIWEVMVMPENTGAYQFWRSTIQGYCGHSYLEYIRNVDHLENARKYIFQFKSERV